MMIAVQAFLMLLFFMIGIWSLSSFIVDFKQYGLRPSNVGCMMLFISCIFRILSLIDPGFYGVFPYLIYTLLNTIPSIFYAMGYFMLISVWVNIYQNSIKVKKRLNLKYVKVATYIIGSLYIIFSVIVIIFGFTKGIDFNTIQSAAYGLIIGLTCLLLVILNIIFTRKLIGKKKENLSEGSKKILKKRKFYYILGCCIVVIMVIIVTYTLLRPNIIRDKYYTLKNVVYFLVIRFIEVVMIVVSMGIIGKPWYRIKSKFSSITVN